MVPHAAGAAVDAQAADGDWSFEDDDDYQLFDPLDLPEAQDQIAAETLVCDSSLSPHHALMEWKKLSPASNRIECSKSNVIDSQPFELLRASKASRNRQVPCCVHDILVWL